MSPVFKTLTNFLGRLTLLLLALSLTTSCAHSGECKVNSSPPARWLLSSRPVEVKISAELEQECFDNVLAGLDFWYEKGITFLVPKSVDKPIAGNGIIISNLDPWLPEPTLATAHNRIDKGLMLYSEIRYRDCGFWVVIHEFGHALGLTHVDKTAGMTSEEKFENVMFSTNEHMGMSVTEKQLEQIR